MNRAWRALAVLGSAVWRRYAPGVVGSAGPRRARWLLILSLAIAVTTEVCPLEIDFVWPMFSARQYLLIIAIKSCVTVGILVPLSLYARANPPARSVLLGDKAPRLILAVVGLNLGWYAYALTWAISRWGFR